MRRWLTVAVSGSTVVGDEGEAAVRRANGLDEAGFREALRFVTRLRCMAALIASGLLLIPMLPDPAWAESGSPRRSATGSQERGEPPSDEPLVASELSLPGGDPSDVLAYGEPTPDGFVVMASHAGGPLQPIASLHVQGMESSMWSGWTCVTGSGRYLGAVFGPVELLSDERLRNAGAFAAVVDLANRSAVMVPERVAYKHHAVGCGPTDEISLLRHVGDQEVDASQLISVDVTGHVTGTHEVAAHLTSPAPVGSVTFAASGYTAVRVAESGQVDIVAEESGQVVDLHANSLAGLDYLVVDNAAVTARRTDEAGEPVTVGVATLGDLRWAAGRNGENQLVGAPSAPVHGVDVVPAVDRPAAVSLDGTALVNTTADLDAAAVGVDEQAIRSVDVVQVEVSDPRGGETADAVLSLETAGMARLDAVVAAAENYTNPKCAVPRNDPALQVLQPSPGQVEWAVHKAVRGELTGGRPAGWRGYGLPAYSPQGAFPRTGLGQSGRVPAQVLLGVLAQESNLWQASRGALPGVAGNPLIGDYYGVVLNSEGRIIGMNYDNADCGYGIGQVTDHMTVSDTFYSADQKKMIALDYQANIAASLQILEEKWRTGKGNGTWVNDGDPAKVENWYFPIWAYNSGWKTQRLNGTPDCCLGWSNNPANSDWLFERSYFQRASLDDARFPGNWAYQERVLGFAERGLWLVGERAFTPVEGWLDLPIIETGTEITDPIDRFILCEMAVNECSPTHYDPGSQPVRYDRSFCTVSSRECFWNGQKQISHSGVYQYEEASGYSGGGEPPVPADDLIHPPACSRNASLPPPGGENPGSNAAIVDDVSNMSYNLVGCPAAASAGSFNLDLGTLEESGAPLAAIDLHQIGAGYGGHFWYAHTNWDTRDYMTVVGSWTPPASSTGWTRISAHIPDHGADTYQADYLIFTSDASYQAWRTSPDYPSREGADYHRTVNQRWNQNRWIDLGIFQLSAGARVVLTNETFNDANRESYDGRQIDIAWDAMSFAPAAEPTVSYVAMGDSYSSGEGVGEFYANSDVGHSPPSITPGYVNNCHRSSQAESGTEVGAYATAVYARLKLKYPGQAMYQMTACSGAATQHMLTGTRYGEVPQLQQGWLDENTTHVSLTISGNDIGFAEIVEACHLASNCSDAIAAGLEKLPDARTRLTDVLDQIANLAPSARIVLLSYPYIVSEESLYESLSCSLITEAEQNELRAGQVELTAMLEELAATRPRVVFIDPREHFAGHEACSGVDQWVNDLVGQATPWAPEPGSFHPTARGQHELSVLVADALGLGSSK